MVGVLVAIAVGVGEGGMTDGVGVWLTVSGGTLLLQDARMMRERMVIAR